MTRAVPNRLWRQRMWDACVLVVAVLLGFALPVRVVLGPPDAPLPLWLEVLLTLFFAADAAGRFARDRWRPSLWTAVDVIAALPLALFLGPTWSLVRLVKLARLVGAVRNPMRQLTIHPTGLRLGVFAFVLAISAHWLACGWIWLDGPGGVTRSGPYVDALYWCISTLTTVGYGDVTPVTSGQTLYAMVVMLLGVGLYGFVIGNLATLLTSMDMAKAQYLGNLERLTSFLRYRRIPVELQHHIYDYYRYLWENRMGYDEASILATLPPTLREELTLVLKADLIEKVSFLQGASRELISALCRELYPVVFTPGDIIVRAGEYGRQVYFISAGEVEVFSPEGQLIRTMREGDFFGELALLHDQPRSATVRAVGYCDLYALERDAFERTIACYPDFAADVSRISEERTI